jgi:flagellar protein FlaG
LAKPFLPEELPGRRLFGTIHFGIKREGPRPLFTFLKELVMSIDIASIHSGSNIQILSQATQAQAAEQPRQPAQEPVNMQQVIQELASISASFNKRLSFSYNDKIEQTVVKVIDTSTDRVIREIPPAELQRVHERIKEVLGILFDEQA